jgi:hypothetical protein
MSRDACPERRGVEDHIMTSGLHRSYKTLRIAILDWNIGPGDDMMGRIDECSTRLTHFPVSRLVRRE